MVMFGVDATATVGDAEGEDVDVTTPSRSFGLLVFDFLFDCERAVMVEDG